MIVTLVGVVLVAVGAWLFIRASVFVALGLLLGVSFLVPGVLLVPGSTSTYATIHRFVLVLFILNILRKLARSEISASELRPARPVAALAGWVVLTLALGVAMADQSYDVSSAVFLWVHIVEYSVFFFFVTGAIRIIGDPWRVARLGAAVFTLVAGAAIYEHFSGVAIGPWLARRIRAPSFHSIPGLGERGGDVRVQAGFEFALAFAWGAAIVLPLVLAVASRARNWLFRLAPGAVALAIAWTYARSVYAGVAAGLVVLVLLSRFDARIVGLAVLGLVAAVGFAVQSGAYDRTFESEEVQGSTRVREERLPVILTSAAEEPFAGKGLGSIAASGIRTTDSLFLLTYGEIGVVGVAGLGFLLLATIIWISPGLRAPPPDRVLAAACVCGLILGVASGAFVDGFSVSGVVRAFWFVAALGTVVAERVPSRPRAWSVRPLRRAMIPVAGVLAGLILYVVASPASSWTLRFSVQSASDDVVAVGVSEVDHRVLINTICTIIQARTDALGHDADCYGLQAGAGVGDVRFEAPNDVALYRDSLAAGTVVRARLPGVRFFILEPVQRIRATWVRTAPVWMGLTGLTLALLLPPLPPLRGRRRDASMVLSPAAA